MYPHLGNAGGSQLLSVGVTTEICVTHSRSVSKATAHLHRFGKVLIVWQGGGIRIPLYRACSVAHWSQIIT